MNLNRDTIGGQSVVRLLNYGTNAGAGFDTIESIVGSEIYNPPSSTAHVDVVLNARNLADDSFVRLYPGDAVRGAFSNVRVRCEAQWNTTLQLVVFDGAGILRGHGDAENVVRIAPNASIARATHAWAAAADGDLVLGVANAAMEIDSVSINGIFSSATLIGARLSIFAAETDPGPVPPTGNSMLIADTVSTQSLFGATNVATVDKSVVFNPPLIIPAGWGLYYIETTSAAGMTSIIAPTYSATYTFAAP